MSGYIYLLEEIIKEATTGISSSSNYYPLLFNTKEMRYTKLIELGVIKKHYPDVFEPTLTIVDRKKFEQSLNEYIGSALDFYKDDKKFNNDDEPIKYILYNVFYNIFLSEFDDVRSTFVRQLDFIKNERLCDFYKPVNMGYIKSLLGNLVIGVSKCNSDSVTPYNIQISIERLINNKLYYYDFPCIKYGISKGTAYIFEIENTGKRKPNKNLENDKNYQQELKDYQNLIKDLLNKIVKTKEIDPNIIISLVCTLSLFRERGINNVIVPSILINRYNGFEIICYQNLSRLNKIYEEAKVKKESAILEETVGKISAIQQSLNNHEAVEYNEITNLIKHFKYLEEIYSDYKVYEYPMQKDTNLHFHIIPNGSSWKVDLLKEFNEAIKKYEKDKHK